MGTAEIARTLRERLRTKHILLTLAVFGLILFQMNGIGFAAGSSEDIASAGTGLGGTFDQNLTTLANGAIKAMHIVLVVMTAIAGMMVAFGIEDGKKFIWQLMLGAGLAFNFGSFLMGSGVWSMANQTAQTQQVEYFTPELVSGEGTSVEDISILGSFMNHYTEHVIVPGAENILPYCLRLLVILTVVQATWELTVKFMSGDKLQYLINMTLKMGFFMFLMMNWISLMGSLMSGFEVLGFRAGGNNTAIANNIVGEASDTFVQIALKMFTAIWTPNSDSWIPDVVQTIATAMQPGVLLLDIVCILVIGGCLFLVALEMFMARIEFYTMALLALPCLAFGTMNKFNFLTEKAIGAMFNLALKVCVIAFLSAVSKPFIEGFADKIIQADNPAEDLALLFQAVLASLLIYLLVKKIPQLVSGLLSGQPQLSGSDMTGALKGAVAGAAAATGNVAAAQAAAAAAGKGGMGGTLTQLGRNYVMSRSPVRSYRDAISGFRQTKDYTGSRMLQEIRTGVDSFKRNNDKGSAVKPDKDNQEGN